MNKRNKKRWGYFLLGSLFGSMFTIFTCVFHFCGGLGLGWSMLVVFGIFVAAIALTLLVRTIAEWIAG